MPLTLDHLRRYAVARSLFKPTTLRRAIEKLGFVQADPIRAPARAQDLTLRHRVIDYSAGDLERRYSRLPIEEDFFVNYGFLPRAHHHLMHPRIARTVWTPARAKQAQAVLEFVRQRRIVHPRQVEAHFAHGRVTNWFGGTSSASTQLLDVMHYRGMLRVARREGGTRMYSVRHPADSRSAPDSEIGTDARMDALVDLIVRKYAPLPAATFGNLIYRLRGAVPQWASHRKAAWDRAKLRLPHAQVDGVEWYWPPEETPQSRRWRPDEAVRLLTPFDPIVWDRRRFEIYWGWAYRFEAYTPAPKRKLGYYALPLLWGTQVIGWANLSSSAGSLRSSFGYSSGRAPRSAAFRSSLEAEITRMRDFLATADADIAQSAD
jgi:uncharacterized protein YcaQ